jgi:hypothetical protein
MGKSDRQVISLPVAFFEANPIASRTILSLPK